MPTAEYAISEKERENQRRKDGVKKTIRDYAMSIPVFNKQGVETPQIPCIDVISPVVYALDVMVPIVEFGQEQRCYIRPDPKPVKIKPTPGKYCKKMVNKNNIKNKVNDVSTGNAWWSSVKSYLSISTWWSSISSWWDSAAMWRFIKVLYTLVGWTITSVLLLSINGLARRHSDK